MTDDPDRPDSLSAAIADEIAHDPAAAQRPECQAEAARLARQAATWTPRGVMPDWGVHFGGVAT